MSATAAAATKTRRRGRRVTPRPRPPARPSSGRAFGASTTPPRGKVCSSLLPRGEGGPKGRMRVSASPRPHLQVAKGGAAVTIGVVHVFGRRRRIDVATRRNGAHDIGHGDEGRLALGAIERRNETIVAIFGMDGLGVLAE